MEFFIYLKSLTFFFLLFVCGIIIIQRLTEETRAQVLIPSGAILGIALYVFLINLTAHFMKGIPGFYISLIIEISIAFLLKHFLKLKSMELPKEKTKVFISILFWAIFLYIIVATGILGGDVIYHYSLASLFSRGDYPMHAPWQPDYIMTYHIGSAEFLGAVRSITGAPYAFIHHLVALFMLLSWSQILTWILIKKFPLKLSSLIIISTPAFVGLVSLGGFMIAWPISLSPIQFDGNIFQWFAQLPALRNSQDSYGSPLTLDMMIYFLHRFLSLSFFLSLLTIIIFPKRNYVLLIAAITILLSSIALVDESVLIVILPAVFIISFFKVLNKSIFKTASLIILSILVICLQGGIVTETLISRQGQSGILFFPQDKDIRNYIANQTSSRLFENLPQYQPFRWFHPGIAWQLVMLLLICIFIHLPIDKSNPQDSLDRTKLQSMLWFLFISSLTALVAYYGIVPKLLSQNGNRFLALSYYLSGLGIAIYLIYWWLSTNKRLLFVRSILVWILLFSLIPPFFNFFPRPQYRGLMRPEELPSSSFNWIRNHLSIKERILVLTQPTPYHSALSNIALVTQVGALTPMWDITPRVENVFDMGPTFIDIFYTLNPGILKKFAVNYLIIGSDYKSQLIPERKKDLENNHYFEKVFTDSIKNEIILKITSKYLLKGKDLEGTLQELEKIAPEKGTFYIEYLPNLPEQTFRALRLLLHDRDVYHPIGAAFYNGSIDVKLIQHNTLIDSYDYLVLAESTDPKTICHCDAKLLWSGLGNGIKLWKTN